MGAWIMATTVDSETAISFQTSVPSTGGTVSLTREKVVYAIIRPAGTLATLTVNMPSNPQHGDEVVITSEQILTALTLGNGTIIGAVTSLVVGGFARYIYTTEGSAKWFRVG